MKKLFPFIVLLISTSLLIFGREYSRVPGERDYPDARAVYDSLSVSTLSFDVFEKAYAGYVEMNTRSLVNRNLLTIIDYTLSSVEKRLWVIDLEHYQVLHNDWVAHGRRSGDTFARTFSNIPGSNMSSTGFFVTAGTYQGKHGLSLYLDGLQKGINDNARSRAIVIHGAEYVSESFIKRYKRLGRSLGCPALPLESNMQIIETIKDRTCLYIHGNEGDHLNASGI